MTGEARGDEAGAERQRWRSGASYPLFMLIERYEWVHLTIGILGNATFFVGSILFLYEGLKTTGTWLFILGSLGMLIGSAGSAIVRLVRRRRSDL